MTPRHLIVIDLFDAAEELDVVGPWEVFAFWCQTFPEDGWDVALAADTAEPVRCAKGLKLTPTHTFADVGRPALVVEPGGRGSRTRMRNDRHLSWLRECATDGALMTSVCTGALVLASASLLRGRPAITHHEAVGELAAADPTVSIQRGERWVDDGDVVTAAGVSAGIDMALHLVGRLAGVERAREVQSGIEYFPAPPLGVTS